MDNIVMQRRFDPALDEAGFQAMAVEATGCMDLYRVTWKESLMAHDGSSLVCRFEAPDAESIRQMARGDSSVEKRVWTGGVFESGRTGQPNVIVERLFEEPARLDELQAREDAAAWCLEEYRVTFLRTLLSADAQRMLCLYHAPDAESVRRCQETAGMPVHRVWACRHYNPDNIFR